MEALKIKEAEIPERRFFGVIPRKDEESVPGDEIFYPESDGKPMSDNTKQYRWIVKIKEGIESMYADAPDVFTAADLFWYPVKGDNMTKAAPDVMVAFGRPKGDRGSYRQWEEDNIAPHIVFEILSPGNTPNEMNKKFEFYERHGVEEYYIYDPDRIEFRAWLRFGSRLHPVINTQGWISPGLKIRFEIIDNDLTVFRPDGRKFLTPLEAERSAEEKLRNTERLAESKIKNTERLAEVKVRNTERLAEVKIKHAETKAGLERERAEKSEEKARKLAERLRLLGIDPETV